jgi:hypothetical protein
MGRQKWFREDDVAVHDGWRGNFLAVSSGRSLASTAYEASVESDILAVVDDPSLAGETHWNVVNPCGWLREEKQIDLSDKLIESIRHMIDRPKFIRSVCRTHSE